MHVTPRREAPAAGSNWGRWGADDEIGALNLIDDAVRLRALQIPRNGRLYSLSHPVGDASPRTEGRHPVWHTTTVSHNRRTGRGSADDVLILHTHVGTHMDALSHYWGAEGLYNGRDWQDTTPSGAPALRMDSVTGIVTRCLLVDVAKLCPAGSDAWGFVLSRDRVEGELRRYGLRPEPGDAVLFRTGWSTQWHDDRETYNWGEPGIGLEVAEWLASLDVAVVGADNWAVEAVPPEVKGEGLAVHRALLNRYGIHLVENLDLEAVATAEGTCPGALMLAPLRVTGGVGSPLNPLLLT